jgi:hypothetical protein
VALIRLEAHQRPGRGLDLLVAGAERDRAVDHDHPGVLLHLVVPELLACGQADEHGAGLVVALEDDRRPAPVGSLDLTEPPRLHRDGSLTAACRRARTAH